MPIAFSIVRVGGGMASWEREIMEDRITKIPDCGRKPLPCRYIANGPVQAEMWQSG